MSNRIIKFRIWDDYLKTFIYFDLFSAFGRIPSDCRDNIQQFTGLFDKNGKEIFEGDIIQYLRLFDKEGYIKTLTSFIRYEDAKFGFDLTGFNGMFFNLSDEWNVEIIGNIFENPELLIQK